MDRRLNHKEKYCPPRSFAIFIVEKRTEIGKGRYEFLFVKTTENHQSCVSATV